MNPGLLIAITGLPGSGKTTAASYIAKSGSPVVYMGRITKLLLFSEKLDINEENEKFVRSALRRKYGKEIYAEIVVSEIKGYIKEGKDVYLEGLRSPEELNFLKKYIKEIRIIHIETEANIRYGRVLKRKNVPLTIEQIKKRDIEELKIFGLRRIIKRADYVVRNNTTKEMLYRRLNDILEKIKKNDQSEKRS